MGQKANPYALRLIINRDWKSFYFVRGKKQSEIIRQETAIRDIIISFSKEILQIKVERSVSDLLVFITTSNLSYLTEKNNKRADEILKSVKKIVNDEKINVKVNLIELKNVFSNSQYVANSIASKIESRTPFRVALRTLMSKSLTQREVKGIKVKISGRLDGSEISKTEKVSYGKVPLSTLTSFIDYAQSEAKPTYGKIGITVWIYKVGSPNSSKKFEKRFFEKRHESQHTTQESNYSKRGYDVNVNS